MMTEKQFSIVDIPGHLATIKHIIEEGDAIELTQAGEAVAVLISVQTFHNLLREQPTFWDALQAFRQRYAQDLFEYDGSEFAGLRDRTSGRADFANFEGVIIENWFE